MACSAQSAKLLVEDNRCPLVRKLKNLGVSVIVENLNDHGVFGDEEVSKIKAERDDYNKSRKILDSVIKKGEAACEKLLKVIDTMLRRTSGRTSSLPERKTEALTGTKEFDLDVLISCFPFKDDTEMDLNYSQGLRSCHRYKEKLQLKAQNRSKGFWRRNKNQFEGINMPDLSYSPLVLNTHGRLPSSKIKKAKKQKSKMIRPKKLRKYIPEDRPEVSPSDLLKKSKNIVIVGKPGIGKTALSHEMLKRWAETDSGELDYMFYFDMRETSLIRDSRLSLEELLFSAYSEPDEDKEEVFQDIKKYSDKVTIIFDGITDLSSSVVKRIVENDLLPNAKVIITCRPDDEKDFFSGDFDRVEVKGFSEQTIQKYFSVIGREQKVSSNLELFTLCHVPMYALMVAVCLLSETPEDSPQPGSMTEIYINIVRFCLQTSSGKKTKNLNTLIEEKRADLLTLAEAAFHATEDKTVSLADLHCEDSCVLSFLKSLDVKVAPTETTTIYAFLHYTMQEFFAAVWLLKSPDQIRGVFQQCLTEERKHMKHLLPFMCRLLTKKRPSLMEHLIPAQELKNTSNWFFKEMISTFLPDQCMDDEAPAEDTGPDVDILFSCLFESQCPDACTSFLEKLDYQLDLSGESLDSYLCCAVAYVVAQSKEKVQLNLKDVSVSEEGMRHLYGCLINVQCGDHLPKQLLKIVLSNEGKMDLSLFGFKGNQLHLPVQGKKQLFEIAAYFIQNLKKIDVYLHWDNRESTACPDLCGSLLEALLDSRSLSFRMTHQDPGLEDQEPGHGTLERKKKKLLLDLCLQAARYKEERFHHVVFKLVSLFSVDEDLHNFFVDLYQHVKTRGGLDIVPKLGRLFQSADGVWFIDLSEIKTSFLLEVLRLRPEKTPVVLGCPYEESEVRSFLQCLPHISQLSFSDWSEREVEFCGRLFCAAAERDQQTGENTLQLLSSLCSYKTFPFGDVEGWDDFKEYQCEFLLDLYSHMKNCETQTGLRVLPSLQSVLQSAPVVWFIDLSEIKTSILLEVLRLRPEKTPVKLKNCPYEESEVRSFLQCLPHISQLSFSDWSEREVEFCGRLFCAAAERDQQTGENTLQLLSSLCSYKTFPFDDVEGWDDFKECQCEFLLDLYSHMKNCETQTGLRVLPSLQSVLQSAPVVWFIDLSKRKTSILLEVLRLRPEKTPVKLKNCPYEESEVRSFLQCLPHISQLSFSDWSEREVEFCGRLFCAAAERDQQTGENTLQLLSSLCSYKTFPFDDVEGWDDFKEYQCEFLLDLYSHMKNCETQTGLRVLPSLQSVLQSVPALWSIDLSEIKTSILLEVLRLRPEKTPVKLKNCPYEESEVKSFLQCLPHISQLSFSDWSEREVEFCGRLFCAAAAERDQQTGENTLQLLSSLCSYKTFPFDDVEGRYNQTRQCAFLLDLYSHMKNCETQTGLRVLPSLQSVLQSAPVVWFIDLSKRKTSILLEVLRLRPEKTPVELKNCPYEESEVRSFLQCLPHISQLSCSQPEFFQVVCRLASVRSRDEAKQLVTLLQLLGFNLQLTGKLHSSTCKSVGQVLGLCGPSVDLILTPRMMSVREASLLFRHTKRLHSLRLSNSMALLLSGWVRRQRVPRLTVTEQLSLASQSDPPSEKVSLRVVSSLASLLRYWKVRQLDLTEACIPARCLISLLCHDGPLTIKLQEETSLQLLDLLYQTQDEDLTLGFLRKVNGDLTPFCLNWELLHHLLQQSSQIITVNLRKNSFLQESLTRLLPFLDRITFVRISPGFTLTSLREIYTTRASSVVPSLLRSFDHVINLTCQEMDSEDCAALLFILKHCDGVKLNLLWTSIPTGEIQSILCTLDKVSQLSVDRNLLLKFVYCCASSDDQQRAAVSLLRALQHRLDLSCSSCVELSEKDQSETLRLTVADCSVISIILRYSSQDTELHLQDCEVEDSGLDLLFSVLDRVRLRANKVVLLQLVLLLPLRGNSVRRAGSLCKALGGELDLSHAVLDQKACRALAWMLDFSEGLTELDLSHCQLTDQLLLTIKEHLHKVHVLDLSHNKITDASTSTLLELISNNSSIETVRIFRNNIVIQAPFEKTKKFEIW